MVIYRDEALEDPFIYDVKLRQSPFYMMLTIFHQHLSRFIFLGTDDSFMTLLIQILITVLTILPMLVLIQIGGEGLPGQNISAISLIS